MTRKRFKPIEINCDSPQDIFDTHRGEISKAIIDAISFGVRNKKKKVTFAQVIIKGVMVISLSVEKREFLSLIDQNLEILVELEEYESCALAVKLRKKIENENKKMVTEDIKELVID